MTNNYFISLCIQHECVVFFFWRHSKGLNTGDALNWVLSVWTSASNFASPKRIRTTNCEVDTLSYTNWMQRFWIMGGDGEGGILPNVLYQYSLACRWTEMREHTSQVFVTPPLATLWLNCFVPFQTCGGSNAASLSVAFTVFFRSLQMAEVLFPGDDYYFLLYMINHMPLFHWSRATMGIIWRLLKSFYFSQSYCIAKLRDSWELFSSPSVFFFFSTGCFEGRLAFLSLC